MIAPIDAFVAGAYYTFFKLPNYNDIHVPIYATTNGPQSPAGTALWTGASQRGFNLITTSSQELVEGDVWGGSVIDTIYRGGNMFMQWDAITFKPGSLVCYWPWANLGEMGVVGRLGSVWGGELVMSAAPFTPASGVNNLGQVVITSLYSRNTQLAENFQAAMLFDSRLRRLPIRMRLLPFYIGSYVFGDATNISLNAQGPVNNTSNLNSTGQTGGTTLSTIASFNNDTSINSQFATVTSATNSASAATNVPGSFLRIASVPRYAWYELL